MSCFQAFVVALLDNDFWDSSFMKFTGMLMGVLIRFSSCDRHNQSVNAYCPLSNSVFDIEWH